MAYNVTLENFEGPLDLLLFLVRKNEIDIQDISIILITEQYLKYLEIMKNLNLDIAGQFLVMAATLMQIKSRSLLPKTDLDDAQENETTLDDLKKQLIEYQQYKEAAMSLKDQNILEKDVFVRTVFSEPSLTNEEVVLNEASLFDLMAAFKKILDRSDEKDALDVTVEQISVKDKINEIMQKIEACKNGMEFTLLFSDVPGRLEIITTFLAMLELMKLQAVKVFQNLSYSRIYIYPVSDEEIKHDAELSV